MESLILKCDSAFLAHRQIHDELLVVNEVLEFARRNKKECSLVKLDFQKTYNCVSWGYLIDVMDRMEFDSKWKLWMKSLVFNSLMSILVNGVVL